MIRAVTVYCSSSGKLAPAFNEATAQLARAIARSGWTLVYGGNAVGNMGVLADAARGAGGKVIGVTPQLFVDKGVADHACDELLVTNTMRDRKALMEERGDAFVALPGGLGTYEEFFEIVCGKQLGYHAKPIVLLNVAGFYDPLIALIDHALELNFIRPRARDLWHVAGTVDDAIEYLKRYRPPATTAAATDLSFETAQPPSAIE